MNNKIVIDIKENNSDSFVLNLKDIDSLSSIHLSKQGIVSECEEVIKKKDFEYAKELLKLAVKLSSYGDKEIDELKDKVYGYSIIYKYDNRNNERLDFYLSLLLEIKTFISIIQSQVNLEFNEEIVSLIKKIKDIKEEININKLIDETIRKIKNIDVNVKELEYIIIYTEENSNKELKEKLKILSDLYKEELNNRIVNISKLAVLEEISRMKQILDNVYEKEFFESEEFIDLILRTKTSGYENCNILLELIDKEYLVYRFNNEKNLEKKKYLLYNELLPGYIELPILYKEYVIEELTKRKNKYRSFEKFNNVVIDIINEVNILKEIKSIPL